MGELIKPHVLHDLLSDWPSFLELGEAQRRRDAPWPSGNEFPGCGTVVPLPLLKSFSFVHSFFPNIAKRVKARLGTTLEPV